MGMFRKCVVLFFLLAPLFCAAESIPPEDIGTLTHLAKKFRPRNQQEETDFQYANEVFDRLTFLGAHGNLKIPISILISNVLQCRRDTYKIIDSKMTALHGKSKDEVFFILDETEALRYVVKAFYYQNVTLTRFLEELSGMALIHDRRLSHVDSVAPLAMGKCKSQGINYVLLLESAAPGNRLDRSILSIRAFPKDDPRRSKRLFQVAEMLETVGMGLAELQGFDRKTRAVLLETGIMAMEQALYQLSTKEQLQGLNLKDLKAFTLRQIRQILGKGLPRSYLHGDATPTNIFYDSEKKKAILIDVYRIHRTVNRHGHPIAHGYYDLINFHRQLERMGRPHLTEEELQLLVVSFYKGYAGVNPLPEKTACKKNDIFCSLLCRVANQKNPNQNLRDLKQYIQMSK